MNILEALILAKIALRNTYHPSIPKTKQEEACDFISFVLDNNFEELFIKAIEKLKETKDDANIELSLQLSKIIFGKDWSENNE